MEEQEDDVLSLSAHDTWPSEEDSEISALDLDNEEFIVLDEVVGEEPQMDTTSEDPDARMVVDQEVGEDLCAGLSSRAPGPVEEPAASSGPLVSKNRLRKCYVCGYQSREKMRRHVMREHLPWFWSAATACWDCNTQEAQTSSLAVRHSLNHQVGCTSFDDDHLHMWCLLLNGSLHLLASWFELDSLEGLLQYVIDRKLYQGLQSGFSRQKEQFLLFYAQTYSPRDIQQLIFKPPNHVACLTNWEIMAALLRRLSAQKQQKFKTYRKCLTFEGEDVQKTVIIFPEPFVFVDTHFHLDLTLKRLDFKNFSDMQYVIAPRDDHGFYYGIANFVFPRHWSSWKSAIGSTWTVYVTFGIHPHDASFGTSAARIRELNSLLDDERCVGVGETGLDYTTRCRCSPCRTPDECSEKINTEQERAFKEQLQMARNRNLPVVLHCRDRGDGAAAARVLEIIAELNCLNLKIHRHCFTGSIDELRQWQSLPNVVFGLTWKSVKECPTLTLTLTLPYCCPKNTTTPVAVGVRLPLFVSFYMWTN